MHFANSAPKKSLGVDSVELTFMGGVGGLGSGLQELSLRIP